MDIKDRLREMIVEDRAVDEKFLQAVQDGDMKKVTRYINLCLASKEAERRGLSLAQAYGHIEIVKFLVESEITPDDNFVVPQSIIKPKSLEPDKSFFQRMLNYWMT